MNEKFDFERYWLDKFSKCIDKVAGEEIRAKIMQNSETFNDETDREEIIKWSKKAIDKLDSLLDKKSRIDIMTECACHYPKSQLQEIKKKYGETKDIILAQRMLQSQFESLLKDTLKLDEEMIEAVVNRGWGSAGVREGNKIIATKIPKSGFIIEYMNEKNPEKKKQYYCHCPRVRDAIKLSKSLPITYCYCGAGFYKGIWEEILQKPVKVEVLETVLSGGDVCKVVIHLPEE